MGLIEQTGDQYALTGEGRQFVVDAVEQWAGTHDPGPEADYQVGTYETTAQCRFRCGLTSSSAQLDTAAVA